MKTMRTIAIIICVSTLAASLALACLAAPLEFAPLVLDSPASVTIPAEQARELETLRQNAQLADFVLRAVRSKLVDASGCNKQVIDSFEVEDRAANASYSAYIFRLRSELLDKGQRAYQLSEDGARFEPPKTH